MQIVVEGLALYSFREMRNLTEEPLLKDLLTYVARDESRHHAYGVQYVERCVPLPERRRARRARGLRARGGAHADRQPQPAGALHARVLRDLGGGRHRRGRAVRLPAARARRADARRCRRGAASARCRASSSRPCAAAACSASASPTHYHEFLRANLGSQLVGEDVEEFLRRIPDLPEDTAAWVLGELH